MKGFGIGNGLSDPITQVYAYADYSFSTGLVDAQQKMVLEAMQDGFYYL